MKKILIIEDEQTLQQTLGDFLKKEGFEIANATDGEIGVRSAKTEAPDLILLDLILPKKHGLEVLKELKDNEDTKKIPVIILTNIEDAEEVDKALELGATTYLVKTSYRLEEITSKVKETLAPKE